MGLRVFPCNGKKPATSHGCKDATTDPAQIEEWWGNGSIYNVAIATGNGLVVLDVDADHDAGKYGDETLADLERQYGPLPETWMCLTGGGGVHYYFRCNDPALTVAAGFAALYFMSRLEIKRIEAANQTKEASAKESDK